MEDGVDFAYWPVAEVIAGGEGFSVLVLPFRFPGSDPELGSLAEGLSDGIVAGLARFSYLRVISRASTQCYATATADARSVGRELGARYAMDGSLRQAGLEIAE